MQYIELVDGFLYQQTSLREPYLVCVRALRHANFMFLQGSGRHLNPLPAHQSINQSGRWFTWHHWWDKATNQPIRNHHRLNLVLQISILSHLAMVLETHMMTCGAKKQKKQRHYFGFRAANFCQELTGSASIIHSLQKHGGFLSHGESPIAGLLRVEHPKTKWRIWGYPWVPPILFVYFRQDPGSGMVP